jgi:hypothetical protein
LSINRRGKYATKEVWFSEVEHPFCMNAFPHLSPLSVKAITFCNELIVIVYFLMLPVHFKNNERASKELEGVHLRKYFSVTVNDFKLSPAVGQWMAQLILTDNKPDDMQHFAVVRFTQGREIRPRYQSSVLG